MDGECFTGYWHFSFDQYWDPENTQFGALRVFNVDTLIPGAVGEVKVVCGVRDDPPVGSRASPSEVHRSWPPGDPDGGSKSRRSIRRTGGGCQGVEGLCGRRLADWSVGSWPGWRYTATSTSLSGVRRPAPAPPNTYAKTTSGQSLRAAPSVSSRFSMSADGRRPLAGRCSSDAPPVTLGQNELAALAHRRKKLVQALDTRHSAALFIPGVTVERLYA